MIDKIVLKIGCFHANKNEQLEPHSSLPNTLLANLPIRLFISPVKILSQSTVARLSFTHYNTDDWLVP